MWTSITALHFVMFPFLMVLMVRSTNQFYDTYTLMVVEIHIASLKPKSIPQLIPFYLHHILLTRVSCTFHNLFYFTAGYGQHLYNYMLFNLFVVIYLPLPSYYRPYCLYICLFVGSRFDSINSLPEFHRRLPQAKFIYYSYHKDISNIVITQRMWCS